MYNNYVSWDKFTPHVLNTYHLPHGKDIKSKTIARDYICLDTETSHGVPDAPSDFIVYKDPEILDHLEGLTIYIPDNIKNNIDYKYYSKIMRRCKIKRSLDPLNENISEVYERINYLCGEASKEVNEEDQLTAILNAAAEGLDIVDEHNALIDYPERAGWVYQWAFSYPYNNGDRLIVYGRTPSQLAYCFQQIQEVNNTDENHKILIFVHNLSYDHAYCHGFINAQFGERGEILATAAHRLISYTIKGLEFRDSLKISQRSLAKWGKDLDIKHKKLTGLIDYKKQRFQDTPLDKNDWRYMVRDVISLDECIRAQMALYDDTTKTIPLTNTGYVRRETRKLFRENKRNRQNFKKCALNYYTYRFCRSEFAGGLTHGNRFYAEYTLNIDDIKKKLGRDDIIIKHRDFASHYPSQQICSYGPISKFVLYYDHKQSEQRHKLTHDDLLNMNCCYLAMIQISNVHIRQGMTLPTLQVSKVEEGKTGLLDYTADNGRILHIDSGFTNIVVNEHDFKWLVKTYKFQYKILKVYTAEKGPYPEFIRKAVFKFFRGKTYWKNEHKKAVAKYGEDSPEAIAANIQLMINKGMLNSIYGMTCTNIVRNNFIEDENDAWKKELLTEDKIKEKLEKYYNSRNSFMSYQLGLWTTSSARAELLEFAELIGWDNYIYCDTDSIFYISTPEIEAKIEARNAAAREECNNNGWYIEEGGKRVYFNQFEDEKENIIKFRFLHAKCYAYVTDDNNLHCTIAGVPERSKDTTRVKELGSIDDLITGKVFNKCGGTTTLYPKSWERVDPRIIEVEGHRIETSAYAIIEESTKTLKCNINHEEELFFWEAAEQYD